ncbi:hypothetical protein J4454_04320 [Candidatus Pacearchaeota archaeon]|nr:hypothetical protein [Candidatus Pacearchaeota archaeon]
MKLKFGWKFWMLIIILVLSLIAIRPSFENGVLVKGVEFNSSAYQSGLKAGEIIKEFNGNQVNSLSDYSEAISSLNMTEMNRISIKTKTSNAEYTFFAKGEPAIVAADIPKSNIRTGFDLSGGSRALVKPEKEITDDELANLISITENRFNVYGLSDVRVRPVKDLDGNKFMLVEIAGATPEDLRELIGSQGKFEAKIGSDVVFIGGKRDITSVCRFDPSCAGISECFSSAGQDVCNFQFTLYLSEEAAKRHEKLDLYVDDKLTDSLFISEDLKGVVTTQIAVSGSGAGLAREDAIKDAQANMNKLQTILITGSLPFKLEIEKLDSVSPTIGEQLTSNILLVTLLSFLAVAAVIFIRYRQISLTMPILFTMVSEVIITLGVASLIKWNLDLASIAGILGAIGTGVDDQIVIIDEIKLGKIHGWKEKMKRAFFIILGAFATVFVAMLPLSIGLED